MKKRLGGGGCGNEGRSRGEEGEEMKEGVGDGWGERNRVCGERVRMLW